jgi:hypothetical protein
MEAEASQETDGAQAVTPATASGSPGGIYRSSSAMGKLWSFLSDQQWHNLADAAALIHPIDLRGRLKYLAKHGTQYGASHRLGVKTYDWDIQQNGSQIRMLFKQR